MHSRLLQAHKSEGKESNCDINQMYKKRKQLK